MRWQERVSNFLRWGPGGPPPPSSKAAGSAIPIGQWSAPLSAGWSRNTMQRWALAYRANSAIQACIRALALAFPEPPLRVYHLDGQEWPQHRAQVLLDRPNPIMGQAELKRTLMTFRSFSGAAYLHLIPSVGSARDPIAEMYPYSAARWSPVSAGPVWVDHYEYTVGPNETRAVPVNEVVQWAWMPDPDRPWLPVSPMEAVLRELDSDEELTRYIKALLENDAVPRTTITVPPGSFMNEAQAQRLKQTLQLNYGGNRRGEPAVLTDGATINRLGLGLDELAVDGVRNGLEARICSVFGVPALIAGLMVGLQHGREGNWESTRKQFTQQTLVPAWVSLADELTAGLRPWYGEDFYISFDLDEVEALGEEKAAVWTRLLDAVDKGVLTPNEARADLGKEALPGGDGLRGGGTGGGPPTKTGAIKDLLALGGVRVPEEVAGLLTDWLTSDQAPDQDRAARVVLRLLEAGQREEAA